MLSDDANFSRMTTTPVKVDEINHMVNPFLLRKYCIELNFSILFSRLWLTSIKMEWKQVQLRAFRSFSNLHFNQICTFNSIVHSYFSSWKNPPKWFYLPEKLKIPIKRNNKDRFHETLYRRKSRPVSVLSLDAAFIGLGSCSIIFILSRKKWICCGFDLFLGSFNL